MLLLSTFSSPSLSTAAQPQYLVGFHVLHGLHGTIRPADGQFGDDFGHSQTEMQALVVHRHVASAGAAQTEQRGRVPGRWRHPARDDRTDRVAIGLPVLTDQVHQQPMAVQAWRVVAQQNGPIIEVGDQQIQVTVVVHVTGRDPPTNPQRQRGDARLVRHFAEQPPTIVEK